MILLQLKCNNLKIVILLFGTSTGMLAEASGLYLIGSSTISRDWMAAGQWLRGKNTNTLVFLLRGCTRRRGSSASAARAERRRKG